MSLKPLVLPPAQPSQLPSGEPSGDTLVRRAPSSRPHPHLNVPAPWPQVRADLRLWIVLGDLAAVLVPVWALLLLGRADTALAVGVAGGGQVVLVWSMGGLGPGAVDHGRVPSGRLALCALLTCPVSLLAAQTLGAPAGPACSCWRSRPSWCSPGASWRGPGSTGVAWRGTPCAAPWWSWARGRSP
ncbi:hypothetical protein [Actinomyces sp. oral taxon 897]|uniref:hypothetical protein n=1 Tax=Actinomyces sp. oral taxon 897 TaxID=2081702 RepID=UPI0020C3CE4C|nr:hypothetical protein [Actinomyces sp. oral taxon 897]